MSELSKEQLIVLKTLNEVRDLNDDIVKGYKKRLKNDDSVEDTIMKVQAETLEVLDILLATVAKKHGIKIEIEERD